MEPVRASAVPLRQRVRAAGAGDRRVEGRVESGDVGHRGPAGAARLDRGQRGRLVQRRQVAQRGKLVEHGVVDEHRRVAFAAVHHAVRDAVGLRVRQGVVQGQRCVDNGSVDDGGELERRGSRIDGEDPHPYALHRQFATSGMSSPCSRVHARAR